MRNPRTHNGFPANPIHSILRDGGAWPGNLERHREKLQPIVFIVIFNEFNK